MGTGTRRPRGKLEFNEQFARLQHVFARPNAEFVRAEPRAFRALRRSTQTASSAISDGIESPAGPELHKLPPTLARF